MSRTAMLSEQIGMPISTARSRLVKMLMFRELEYSNRNVCYRCGWSISDIDHLSIEHKIPWLHASPDLFWDLDNVAFSHLSCNSRDARQNTASALAARVNRRLKSDDKRVDRLNRGVAWCTGHQAEIPRDRFSLDAGKRDGIQEICRDCRSEYRSPKSVL